MEAILPASTHRRDATRTRGDLKCHRFCVSGLPRLRFASPTADASGTNHPCHVLPRVAEQVQLDARGTEAASLRRIPPAPRPNRVLEGPPNADPRSHRVRHHGRQVDHAETAAVTPNIFRKRISERVGEGWGGIIDMVLGGGGGGGRGGVVVGCFCCIFLLHVAGWHKAGA